MGTLQGKKSRKETAPLHTLTMGYLAVMCSAFLLFPAAGGYERIGDWAYFLWRGLSLVYLVLLALTAAEVALTGGGRIKALLAPLARLSVPRICLLVYVGWSALAAWCSPYEGVWQGLSRHAGLSTILLYAAVFWAVSAYGRWDDRFLWALGAVTVFNAGIGLLQYAGYNPLGLFPEGTGYHDAFILYNGQFMGTLGNVDTLSAFLCLMVPLFYGAYLLSGRRLALIPMGAGIFTLGLAQVSSGFVGLAGAIVLTVPAYGSRPRCWIRGMEAAGVLALALGAATLLEADAQTPLHLAAGPVSLGLLVLGAAMAAAAIWAARTWPEEPGLFRPRRCRGLCAGVLGIGAAGLAAAYCIPFSEGAAGEFHALLHGQAEASFGSGRLRIWQEVLHLIGERPLLGGGPDTLVARIGFTFSRYSEEAGMMIQTVTDAAHNECLNIAVNQGLPALGAYLALLGAVLYAGIRRGGAVSLLLWTALAGYFIQGCFTIGDCGAAALFWLFLALCERDSNHANQ